MSYAAERNTSPLIIQALLNQGQVLTIRSCDFVTNSKDTGAPLPEDTEDYIVKELEPADAPIVARHWNYGLWNQPHAYTRMCIEQNPSAGVYSKKTGELMSWVIHYSFGSLGMLHTPVKFRGKGLAKVAMNYIMRRIWDRGLIPATGIEPRNAISYKLLTGLGFEVVQSIDFIFTS
jgi:GNAT superfamily N-acetyltransferase